MNESKHNKAIRFLIVDDNMDLCDILQDYFELVTDIDLCGIAHNGEEALQKIAYCNPDVVFLDIIMPQLDGLSVLEKLQQLPPENPPKVIVASAIGQEIITTRALSLGANYYMIKPIQLPDLENRIRLVAHPQMSESDLYHLKEDTALFFDPFSDSNIPADMDLSEDCTDEDAEPPCPLDAFITQYLMRLHMPTHILGFQYCVQSLLILVQETRKCPLGKHVYSRIAKEHETNIPCVESAIRKAIGCITTPGHIQASNGTFLTTTAEKIKLELH